MQAFNKTKNECLARDLAVAQSFLARVKGLLGKQSIKEGEGMLLEPCYQIHTCFMKFPIDILFIDKNLNVIKLIKNMVPFRISGIYMRAKGALELPSGKLEETRTEIGDLISFSGV